MMDCLVFSRLTIAVTLFAHFCMSASRKIPIGGTSRSGIVELEKKRSSYLTVNCQIMVEERYVIFKFLVTACKAAFPQAPCLPCPYASQFYVAFVHFSGESSDSSCYLLGMLCK